MKTFEQWWSKFEPQIDPSTYDGDENETRKAVGRCTWSAALDAQALDTLSKGILVENREPEKVKPLAQYLAEYIEHEAELGNVNISCQGIRFYSADYDTWQGLLEQALDAYQSTENVKIRIEPT